MFFVCYDYFCFFFQAEDGIRDVAVTGVQTCALPISARSPPRRDQSRLPPVGENRPAPLSWDRHETLRQASPRPYDSKRGEPEIGRARVGKECRSRWSTYHEKKKVRV